MSFHQLPDSQLQPIKAPAHQNSRRPETWNITSKKDRPPQLNTSWRYFTSIPLRVSNINAIYYGQTFSLFSSGCVSPEWGGSGGGHLSINFTTFSTNFGNWHELMLDHIGVFWREMCRNCYSKGGLVDWLVLRSRLVSL